ncbi:MAG: hypothetical protein SFT94_05545 [Pseudanabaenaceae cyanobacterium bins.68]|nr:hypothetical protein [Pseudanabaenaceae cyanobacterium bins.68]
MQLIDRKQRIIGVAIAGVLTSLGLTLAIKILESPSWGDGWGAARLAPTFAWLKGYAIYGAIAQDPILNTVYPPLTYLAYLPAAVSGDISAAVMVGTAIAMVWFLVPVALWLRAGGFGILLWAGFGWWSLTCPPLAFSGFSIHADAPALGLSALALWLVWGGRVGWGAVVVVLAVYGKQTMVPVVFAIPTYLWLRRRLGDLKNYAYGLGLSGLGISLGLWLSFDPGAMWFNTVVLPASHPWRSSDRLGILLGSLAELAGYGVLPLGILALAGWGCYRQATRLNQVDELGDRPWAINLLAAIFLLSTSLLGRAKVGGVENTLSPSLYMGAIAALLLVQDLYLGLEQQKRQHLFQLFMSGILVAVAVIHFPTLPEFRAAIANLNSNPQAIAYRYAKSHAGQVYFPFHPLAHLWAEGKLYHFHYGLYDRRLGGYALQPSHFFAHVPAQLQLVAFPPRFPSRDLTKSPPMQYLTEFRQQVQIAELPGWTVFIKTAPEPST